VKVVNRIGIIVQCKIYKSNSNWDIIPNKSHFIAVGDTWEIDPDYESVFITIADGRPAPLPSLWSWGPGTLPGDTTGPFSKTAEVVIISKDNHFAAIDLGALLSNWKNVPGGSQLASNGLKEALTYGNILVNTLAIAIRAAGTEASLPSAAVFGIGMLLLQAIGGISEQIGSPDIGAITSAMRNVVTTALRVDTAEKAASSLLDAANWYIGERAKAYSQYRFYESSFNDQDFRKQLDSFLDLNGSFDDNLKHLMSHPEISMYVLPAFKLGLGTYLQMHWLKLCIGYLDKFKTVPNYKIPVEDVQSLRAKSRSCSEALTAAHEAFSNYVLAQIDQLGLAGAPESNRLTPVITQFLTGSKDLSFIDQAVNDFISIFNDLQSDIMLISAGAPPQGIWKDAWTQKLQTGAGSAGMTTAPTTSPVP
jgi:hypothetical protein